MKIIIVGPAHPLRGGLAEFNQLLATNLQAQGHDVVMYSFSLQYPSFLFPGKTQYTDEPAPPHLKIRTVINSVNPLNWLHVGHMMRKENADIILVRYWLPFMGPALGTILRRVKGRGHTKIICLADNIIPHEKRPGDKPFTKYFIGAVDAFITMSKDVLKDLGTFTDKPGAFTPHPPYDYGNLVSKEEACKHLQLDPEKRYLLFFGFIRRYKGLDILLEAMNDPRIKAAGLHLIVAGEYYDDKNVYESIISKNQLQETVHLFTDYIPNREVTYYFSAADLVVQPYRDATQSGITQVAYNFEKPMIVSNVGGLAEVVPDGKVGFVTAPEPAAIADAVLRFFEPGSIQHLHENILAEKQKYSWAVFISLMMKLAGKN